MSAEPTNAAALAAVPDGPHPLAAPVSTQIALSR